MIRLTEHDAAAAGLIRIIKLTIIRIIKLATGTPLTRMAVQIAKFAISSIQFDPGSRTHICESLSQAGFMRIYACSEMSS